MNKFSGYKTYILTAIAFLSYIAFMLGTITWEQFIQLIPILGIGTVAAFRDAINKAQ